MTIAAEQTGKDNPEYVGWAQARQPSGPTEQARALERSSAKLASLERQAAAVEAMSPELRDAHYRLRRLAEDQRAEREQAEREQQAQVVRRHRTYMDAISASPTRGSA